MPIGSVQHLISDISYIQSLSLSLSLSLYVSRPPSLSRKWCERTGGGWRVVVRLRWRAADSWWVPIEKMVLVGYILVSLSSHLFSLFASINTSLSFFWNHFINYLKDPDILAPPPWWKTLSPSKWINTDNFSTLYTLLKTAKTVIDSNLNIFPTRYVTI